MLAETALAATAGGVLLHLQADSPQPGHAQAIVLADGRLLQVDLDARLGTAVVTTPTAAPSRRFALAPR